MRLGGWAVGRLGGWAVGRLGGWAVGQLACCFARIARQPNYGKPGAYALQVREFTQNGKFPAQLPKTVAL
jgi:hypothetical protein